MLSFQFRKLFPAVIVAALLCLVLRRGSDTDRTVSASKADLAEASNFANARASEAANVEEVDELPVVDLQRLVNGAAADLHKASAPLTERRVAIDSELGSAVFAGKDDTKSEYRKGVILARWKGEMAVREIRVNPDGERAAVAALEARPEIEFAEVDRIVQRQSRLISDPLAAFQWHHAVIGTTNAWRVSTGTHAVKVGIVDEPFQMDHQDLSANVTTGWDLDRQIALTTATGIKHSTIAAGIIAAVNDNGIGVSGVSQCFVLPIASTNFSTTSMIYNAIIWAAEHGVRVVSVSWNVAGSATINAAGEYLRQKNEGVLVVAGDNSRHPFDYPSYPYILAVGMTDENNASLSGYGDWVDITAPGQNIYATTVGGKYDSDTGTSYATPMVAGAAACLMSINAALTGAQIIDLLQSTALDLGAPGKDAFYGSGRLDFAKAAFAAFATLPVSHVTQESPAAYSVPLTSGATINLERSLDLIGWSTVNAVKSTNAGSLRLEDAQNFGKAFYRAKVELP